MPHIQFIPFGTPQYDEALQLRNDVLRKPLNLSFKPEDIATEYSSILIGYYNNESILLGCLMLTPIDAKTIQMRQVAVAFHQQKKGIGQALVDMAERIAFEKGFSEMMLHARDTAVPFYKKQDYIISSEKFYEVGIEHYEMKKELKSKDSVMKDLKDSVNTPDKMFNAVIEILQFLSYF